MQSNILLSLLLLSSFHSTEGAFLLGKWLYRSNDNAISDDAVVVEPEERMIILEESIDPVHNNFILDRAPIPPASGSVLTEAFDDSDPLERMSDNVSFVDRFSATLAKKAAPLIEFADLLATLMYGPSQYDDLEDGESSEDLSDDDSFGNKMSKAIRESMAPVVSELVAPPVSEEIGNYEVISDLDSVSIADID